MRIPGTFYEFQLELQPQGLDTIEFQILKKTEIVHRMTVITFDDLKQEIVSNLNKLNILLPKNRMENILSEMEGHFMGLQTEQRKRQNVQIQRQQSTTQMLKALNGKRITLKFIVMGLTDAGKTSIFHVIFEGKLPHETKNLPPTVGAERHEISIITNPQEKMTSTLNIWDMGGQSAFMERYYTEPEFFFGEASTLIFVIDANNVPRYEESRNNLHKCIKLMEQYCVKDPHSPNQESNIFCFLHKMDLIINREENFKSLVDYFKTDPETGQKREDLTFFNTSIYDSSIYSAWTKITQRVLPKSTKLNLLAQELKEDLGVYAALVIEKRTGLPIAISRTLLDDAALTGSSSRIVVTVEKVLPEYELTKLKQLILKSGSGCIFMEIFNEFFILVLLYPESVNPLEPATRARIDQFIKEMVKTI
jgi:GTPase SAR1 family protein/predicted regulator of Ras-like GTPase activity (Roadblock/LC7/MglB family)